jgi:hypothetical protein
MMAYERDENELGALWLREGSKGPFMTGTINGVEVVCFPVTKKSEKSPAWRVMKSKPRESQTMEDPARFREERERESSPRQSVEESRHTPPKNPTSIAPDSDDMDW